VIYRKELLSIFYEAIEAENYLVVVCELDITVFNLKGEKLWDGYSRRF